jgi:hypothetical protein
MPKSKTPITSLCLIPTSRFAVIDIDYDCRRSNDADPSPPVVAWEDIMFHERRQTTQSVQNQLYQYLSEYGFCFIDVSNPHAVNVLQAMRESLFTDFFPNAVTTKETTKEHRHRRHHLQTSNELYVSEKGIPMYKLGYEYTRIRELFRIAGKNPDSVQYPSSERVRSIWLQGLSLMRDTTDAVLDLLLLLSSSSPLLDSSNVCTNGTTPPKQPPAPPPRRHRRGHMGATWTKTPVSNRITKDREGDFSVLYAMHYFNDYDNDKNTTEPVVLPEPGVAVKAHVDPSILVLEPFLCPTSVGLQVWDRRQTAAAAAANHSDTTNDAASSLSYWLDCDGPNSIFHKQQQQQQQEQHGHYWMLLFCGKALAQHIPDIAPTRHRVVAGSGPRCTIIYEQKYQEFFPPPTFD